MKQPLSLPRPLSDARLTTGRSTPAEPAGASTKPSSELFGSRRELLIEHAGFVYRLRITQHNKLILTK